LRTSLQIVFWSTFLLCVSTYFLYPIVIRILSGLKPFVSVKGDGKPFVSVIISAYNEERHLGEKIGNTLSLDYPRDRFEIIVASDGSTDGTVEAAKRFSEQGVRVLDFRENRGKTIVQNESVESSRGEILVFTDAASPINREAVANIVRHFADERVGCVAGSLKYVDTHTNLTTESQGLYWKYESGIRKTESRLGRLIGVDGPLYAIRRDAYVPLQGNIISDLISPLLVLASGRKVILEEDAVALEDPTRQPHQEIRTRRRITLRALVGLREHKELLNPFRNPVLAAQLFFHKLLRWFVGPLALLNAFACVGLRNEPLYGPILAGYAVFFLLAGTGYVLDRFGKKGTLFVAPYYFILVNAAATLGIVDFLRRKQAVTWVPVRGGKPAE
jgi:cellulose synthase/poly-beta-1,6-N-acetylglucosamine synthase-like glycosyltransferase